MQVERRKNFIVSAFEVLPPIVAHLNCDERLSYETKLKALNKRFYNPEFRLAVVGNFSCGKSTFLNALLRRKLLTTDILPTTAIPTYIRWNKETFLKQTRRDERKYCNPIITLTMTGGKVYTLTKSGKMIFERETSICLPDDTGKVIDTLTTTNELIGKIERVDLIFPERRGFKSFCLIDTPGINPGGEESKEHVLQTQKVLREEADAVILLYPTMQTMTRDTEEFMRDNASHLMAGAIILLTKKDLVPKRELEKIIKYTARLVKERFKQEEPQVYPISAQQAIDYFSGDNTDSESLQGANEFNQIIDTIIKQLSERRSEIISRRIADLMHALIDSISRTVADDLSSLEEKRAFLKKAAATNLETDFDKLNKDYKFEVLQKVNSGWQTVERTIQVIIRNRRNTILKKIDSTKNSTELNQCLTGFYSMIMADVEQKVLDELNRRIVATWNESARIYVDKVTECLNRYERYLGEVSTKKARIKNQNGFQVSTTQPVATDESFLTEHAGIIGGVLLTILTGGVGALLLPGSWIVDTFRFNSKKEKAKQEVSRKLEDYEANLIRACKDCIAQVEKESLSWARNLLEEYRANYQKMFDDIEQKHNESVAEVEAQIVRNKKNICRLEDLRELSAGI